MEGGIFIINIIIDIFERDRAIILVATAQILFFLIKVLNVCIILRNFSPLSEVLYIFVYFDSAADASLSLFQSFKPSGSSVSSSMLPVPSTNSSYDVFSAKGLGPNNSTTSSRLKTSFSNKRSASLIHLLYVLLIT